MKIVKNSISIILAVSTLICLMSTASASDESPNISTYAWQQLGSTSNSFDIDDNGKATIVASTTGRGNSTKVTVAMYVERLQSGEWSTVSGMSWSNSSTSINIVSLDKTRWMTGGYYYRLRSEHSATGPNGTEYDTIYSPTYYYGG